MFLLTITAFSQEKSKSTAEVKAQNLANKITQYLQLDKVNSEEAYNILLYKNQEFAQNPDLILERKVIVNKNVVTKFETLLPKESFEKLKANKALFDEINSTN